MTNQLTPRDRLRQASTEEIVEAAWVSCREQGLASLSLRDLAARVGMQAPSLYSYFANKNAIYDAMFRQANADLAEHMREVVAIRPLTRTILKDSTRRWFDFCVTDPVRSQLLFQRTIPGFEPSAESYELAIELLEELGAALHAFGIDDPAALDLWTATLTGLTSQQISNDPGGDRWSRLLDDTIDMMLDHFGAPAERETGEPT